MSVPHARAGVSSLLGMLGQTLDPRARRGARHHLVAVLGVVVVVTPVGAVGYWEMGSARPQSRGRHHRARSRERRETESVKESTPPPA